jgi:hypothetical protein
MAPLVSPLRYATRNHRLAAIAHRLKYHNQRGINNLRELSFSVGNVLDQLWLG